MTTIEPWERAALDEYYNRIAPAYSAAEWLVTWGLGALSTGWLQVHLMFHGEWKSYSNVEFRDDTIQHDGPTPLSAEARAKVLDDAVEHLTGYIAECVQHWRTMMHGGVIQEANAIYGPADPDRVAFGFFGGSMLEAVSNLMHKVVHHGVGMELLSSMVGPDALPDDLKSRIQQDLVRSTQTTMLRLERGLERLDRIPALAHYAETFPVPQPDANDEPGRVITRLRVEADAVRDRIILARHRPKAPASGSEGQERAEDKAKATLPKLQPHDREAWQASLVVGMTQAKVAAELNRIYPGENWTQPRVSEAIKRAKAHAEASGLAAKVPTLPPRAPARTLDPAAAEHGKRTDGKAFYLRDREMQKAKDGDPDE